MGKEYREIDARIREWLGRQQMFFVATAPLDANGHVNCSPKGLDSLRVLGPRRIAYLDTGGSGIETVAHLRENARITIMLCAFEGRPKIFRFYGRGKSVEPGDPEFDALASEFPHHPAVRNIVDVAVERIMDSCGFGVPLFEFVAQRDSLANWAAAKTAEDLAAYRRQNNESSLDGLPGLRFEE